MNPFQGDAIREQRRSALDVQVGGGHYKNRAIQPVEYIHANNLSFIEGCIVKRITRWREKDGFADLEKIKHEVDLLIELEKKYGMATKTQSGGQRESYNQATKEDT